MADLNAVSAVLRRPIDHLAPVPRLATTYMIHSIKSCDCELDHTSKVADQCARDTTQTRAAY